MAHPLSADNTVKFAVTQYLWAENVRRRGCGRSDVLADKIGCEKRIFNMIDILKAGGMK